uniref:Aspartate carbamoyltransferase n=1 Tax=Alexandrium monilatum TaxID=311494 RepID=A0A7S4QEK2_9DINO
MADAVSLSTVSLQEGGGQGVAGRSIQVVSDLSPQEQLYLYERARRLKARHSNSQEADGATAPPLCAVEDADTPEQVADPDSTVYLLFMEGSTRTKESLRNAATYHGVKVNEFQAETSSFQKNETITDTIKMLSVYSTGRSVFVIRSPIEGVCRWLQTAMPKHTDRFGLPTSAFVNAGDGRYTHPMGEIVDVFTILEQLRWSRASLHIALVGDLAHGRTAHTKVDGLKIFGEVRVDLVAPEAIAYPVEYKAKMRSNGFDVREFDSVEQYLESSAGNLAQVWYFYRPQFDRCGDLAPNAVSKLQDMVTFRAEWEDRLPQDVRFFQTLPRDKEHPIVPLAFDALPLNTWDRVANDSYYLHIVFLSMLFGRVGRGLPVAAPPSACQELELRADGVYPLARGFRGSEQLPSFMEPASLSTKDHRRQPERARPGGAVPLKDGLVVDHIGRSCDAQSCWRSLRMVRTVLGWSKHVGSEGVYNSTSQPSLRKGIISLPNFDFETVSLADLQVLASVAPGCTVNAITASAVAGKYRLGLPERIYNLPSTRCKNALCVSNPQNRQRDVVALFERAAFYETSALPGCKAGDYLFLCKYCQWPHQYNDIWTDSQAGRGLQHG